MKHIVRICALVLVVCMMSVTAFAGTPSPEQGGVPEVVVPQNPGNKPGAPEEKPEIVVKNPSDDVVESDEPEVLVITPMNDIENLTPEQEEKMEKAYTQVSEAESLAEVAPELPEVLKELKVETPVEDLVIRDFFHIGVSEKLHKALEQEGNHIDITFKMDLETGEQLIVLVQNAEGEWIIISGDDIVVEDGEVTVSFPCVGPVAFIVV